VDEAWKQLPCAAVIVCASVLGSSNARAEPAPEASTEPGTGVLEQGPGPAPTCGPSCHGGADDQDIQPPPDIVAPTCGPSCHGGGDEPPYPDVVAPPPVEPAKKGCAVGDVDDGSPLGFAALSLGLLAGVAARRRRES
jgi:MYXO-CTERM domain-containing protein